MLFARNLGNIFSAIIGFTDYANHCYMLPLLFTPPPLTHSTCLSSLINDYAVCKKNLHDIIHILGEKEIMRFSNYMQTTCYNCLISDSTLKAENHTSACSLVCIYRCSISFIRILILVTGSNIIIFLRCFFSVHQLLSPVAM